MPGGTLQTLDFTNVTLGDGTNTFTIANNKSHYIVDDDLVFLEIDLQWTSKGSATSTESLKLSLPRSSLSRAVGGAINEVTGVTFVAVPTLKLSGNTVLFADLGTKGNNPLLVSDCASSGSLKCGFWYRYE